MSITIELEYLETAIPLVSNEKRTFSLLPSAEAPPDTQIWPSVLSPGLSGTPSQPSPRSVCGFHL